MKGLILKDFLVMRKYFKTVMLLLVVYAAIGIYGGQSSFLAGVAPMMGLLVSMASFGYDAQAGWDHYGASLPVTRRQMVGARYLSTLLIMGGGLLLGVVGILIMTLLHPGADDSIFGTIAGMLLAGLLACSVVLPILYQFGPERGRVVMILAVLLPILAIGALVNTLSSAMLMALLIAVVALALLLPIPSYLLSCRIMEQKEL